MAASADGVGRRGARADWRPRATCTPPVCRFVERARKRFLQKQRSVLKEAQRAGELVRHEVLPAAPAPAPEPAPPPGPVGDKAPRPMRKLAPAEAPEAAELAVMSLSKDPSPVGLASPVGVSPVGAKEERAAPLPSPPTSPPPSPPPVAPANKVAFLYQNY